MRSGASPSAGRRASPIENADLNDESPINVDNPNTVLRIGNNEKGRTDVAGKPFRDEILAGC